MSVLCVCCELSYNSSHFNISKFARIKFVFLEASKNRRVLKLRAEQKPLLYFSPHTPHTHHKHQRTRPKKQAAGHHAEV